MDNSPLSRFPREVRDLIWAAALKAVYLDEGNIYLTPSNDARDGLRMDIHERNRRALALTLVCKQVREEVMQTFFEINTLVFNTTIFGTAKSAKAESRVTREPSQLVVLRQWIERRMNKNAATARHIDIQLGAIASLGICRRGVFRQWVSNEIVRTIKTVNTGSRTQWSLSMGIMPKFEGTFEDPHHTVVVAFSHIPVTAPGEAIKQCLINRKNSDGDYRRKRSEVRPAELRPAEYLESLARVGSLVETFINDIQKYVEEANEEAKEKARG